MSEIRKYVIVNADDYPLDDCEYDRFDEAQGQAVKFLDPVAIVARVYTYDDSELVWTSTGDDVWPPQGADPSPEEGCDRCACGCKYWEHNRCIDCGALFDPKGDD